MIEFDLAGFENWLNDNRSFVASLNVFRNLREGFSFRIFELDNAAEVAPHYASYQQAISHLRDFWPAYLDKGDEYRRIISDEQIHMQDKISLIDLSESFGHIFHNAAVLYLENLAAGREKDQAVKNYEDHLKDLWLVQVRLFSRGDSQRRQALIDYLRAHTVLGKVIRQKETQFHDQPTLLRMHPAFWGLFLFSRACRADNGRFPIASESAEDEWLRRLTQWNLEQADQPNHYVTGYLNDMGNAPARLPIYEALPREFSDPQVAPRGIYLHRSKSHGRDDYLVVNTPDASRAVFCTKGVGGDPDRVMAAISRERGNSALIQYWSSNPADRQSGAPPLPFEYQYIQGHTGWSVLGFCIEVGNMGEHLGRDYHNFAAMYDFVSNWRAAAESHSSVHPLARAIVGWLPRVFVEPYACIEISRHYQERLRPPIGKAQTLLAKSAALPQKPQPDEVFFGMPVQIVTGAPCETSLRLQKIEHGAAPAYDYECPVLERKEWARCVGPIHDDIRAAVEQDSAGADPNDKEALAVAYQLAAIFVASFIAFQKKGWLTGRDNPSFAPRNFGSGPRDSPDWVSFEDVASKERISLQTTELSNVSSSLLEYIGLSLSIEDIWRKLIVDRQSFPDALRSMLPTASGKADLLHQMQAKAEQSDPVISPSAQLARDFVKALIEIDLSRTSRNQKRN
jgi:hypothetical protein